MSFTDSQLLSQMLNLSFLKGAIKPFVLELIRFKANLLYNAPFALRQNDEVVSKMCSILIYV